MSTYVLNNPYPITSVGPVSADLDDYIMNPMHVHGDIIYGGVAGQPTRLAGNTTTTHRFLEQIGDGTEAGHPAWVSPLASEIVNTPAGSISATNVQDAINELDTDLTTLSSTVGGLPLYVPYTGATGNVDLGTRDITTTGTVTAGLVAGVVPYTGATGNVNLGTYDISVGKVTIADAVVNATDAATKAYVDSEISGILVVNGTDGVDGADGADGSAGADARTVVLTIDNQHFDYNSAGTTPSPAGATITATALNTIGVPYYAFWLNDVEVQNDTTGIYAYTPDASVANMPSKIEVELREGDPYDVVLARDQMTIIGLKAGSDGVTVVLSNEAHTLPTSNTGTVDYTGSGTNIYAWVGTTDMAVDQTASYGNNTFRVTSAVGTNITVGAASGADGSFIRTYGDHSNMTANTASIVYTIVIKNSAGTEMTVTKTQSFAKSIEGADGIGGTGSRAVNLTTGTQGFVYDTSGAIPSPANTTITATPINTSGTPWYEFFKDGSSEQNTTSATYSYTPQASYANMPDVVEVRLREDGAGNPILARDQITLVGLKAGTHGATIILTNEAHTLPTTTAGTVTYTGSGTSISAWHGSTQLLVDQNSTYGNNTFRVTSATGSGITVGSASGADGATARVYGDHTNMTTDAASITYTIVIKDEAGVETTFTKVQTFAKSWQGNTGATGAAGDNGDIGPSPVYRGVYDAGTSYYGNNNRVDIVKYGSNYFVARTDPTASPFSGQTPVAGAYWLAFGSTFDSIATGLLFADLAYVDNLGVRAFSGSEAPAGSLDGAVSTFQAAAAAVPDIFQIELVGGSSGSCDITIDGTMCSASWNTSLSQTANDFIYTASYPNITVANPSGAVLTFTKTTGAIGSFSPYDNGIYATGGRTSTYAAAVAQIDYVQLSGIGGACSLSTDGAAGVVWDSYVTQSGNHLTEAAADFVVREATHFASHNVGLTSSGDTIILTATGANVGTAFSPATASANIPMSQYGGISIRENEIFEDKEDSDQGFVVINNRGYNGGTSHGRILYIGDGKGGDVGQFSSSGVKIKAESIASPGTYYYGKVYYDSNNFLKFVP